MLVAFVTLVWVVALVRLWRVRQMPNPFRAGARHLARGIVWIALSFTFAYTLGPILEAWVPRSAELLLRLSAILAGIYALFYLQTRAGLMNHRFRSRLTAAGIAAACGLLVLWWIGPRHATYPGPMLPADHLPPTSVSVFVIAFDLVMLAWTVVVTDRCWRAAHLAWSQRHQHIPGLSPVAVAAGEAAMSLGGLLMSAAVTVTGLRAAGAVRDDAFNLLLPVAAALAGCVGVTTPVIAAYSQARTRVKTLTTLLTSLEPEFLTRRKSPSSWLDWHRQLRRLRVHLPDVLDMICLCDAAAMKVVAAKSPATALGKELAGTGWTKLPAGTDPDEGWHYATDLIETPTTPEGGLQQLVTIAAGHTAAERVAS